MEVIQKGIKLEVYPTESQKVQLDMIFGCCRKVWNIFLDEGARLYKEFLESGKIKLSSSGLDDYSHGVDVRLLETVAIGEEVTSKLETKCIVY